jgi:hypothetical protein
MCGLARLFPRCESSSEFRPSGRRRTFIPPTWNAAPTSPLPVVRYDAKEHQRSLDAHPRLGRGGVMGGTALIDRCYSKNGG